MARNQSHLVNLAQYVGSRSLHGLMQWFDPAQNLRTAAAIGRGFYHLSHTRRQEAQRNIATGFPDWTAEQVDRVAMKSMEYTFQMLMVEALAVPPRVTAANWDRYIRFDRVGPALEHMIRRGPVICLTAHCGHWELAGYTMALLGFPVTALARPIDNPLISRWLFEVRAKAGMRVVTKWGATMHLPDALKRGECVGFIADQNAGENGLFVPYFNRLASTYKSIALLAIQSRVPIAISTTLRCGESLRYVNRLEDVIGPDDWEDQADPVFYITARYARAMESMIRRRPEHYMWLHRRWKSRPKHERERQPFPVKLREKLESLPWMTQEELDRIVRNSEAPP